MEITQQEALDCFASDDLIGIGMEADAVRRALHPENVATYAVTNPITLDQPLPDLLASVEDRARADDTTICLTQGNGTGLNMLEESFAAIRRRFPSLRLHALSTIDLLVFGDSSSPGLGHALSRLRTAGLDSISGEDLCASPATSFGLVPLGQWRDVHRVAHLAGLTSTAGLVFGLGETSEDLVRHLYAIRALQAETHSFTSFTLHTPAPSAHLEAPTAVEYLRALAIARIVLDNIPSIESNCVTQGLKVAQMALRFGANDAGSLGLSDTARRAAFTEEDLRRVIRNAGFTPVERDPLYRTLFLNN